MSSSQTLVTCIDHIMIRVNDAIYDQVFSLFTDTFQLPISWNVHNYYPPFKAGGIVAGSISMEIFRSGEWQFKEGPGIRLVPHERDEILAMTWKVASLEQAKTFLQAKGMQGKVTAKQVTIAPESTYGLEIRLVE
jgi:hypothetical protein